MDFLELVKKARSCRRFDEHRRLTQTDLSWLVECARVAPSARNAQVLRFVTLTSPDCCQKLVELTKWAGALPDWKGPQPGERPTGFILVLKPETANEFTDYSVGIAAFAIQLAAASRDWGVCMIGAFNRPQISSLTEIPAAMSIALVLGVGVAAETRVLEPMGKDGDFSYWRDSNGVHHVPKRSLEELIIKKIGD